jgi:hypothetical protein
LRACAGERDKITLAVSLDTVRGQRGLHIVMTPLDETETIRAEPGSVVVTLWREAPTVVRGKIAHSSGAVAYFQGTATLIEMAQKLRLRLEHGD